MTIERASRLQFAIHEIVDILTENTAARVMIAIAKSDSSRHRPKGGDNGDLATIAPSNATFGWRRTDQPTQDHHLPLNEARKISVADSPRCLNGGVARERH